jgi:aryl-alcohol dehydrogenase-like predicted oxidoreductase
MKRMRLGKTNLQVSPVVFGGIINTDETQEDANRYVNLAVDAGVNYFDVAPSYGNAEIRLAPPLKHHRHNVYLACKTTKRDAATARKELLDSLAALETDYFDVYQLHALSTENDLQQAFGPGGAMETMLWARKEGLIRHIGLSAHSEEVSLKACELYDFDTVLFPMNWAMGLTTGWGDKISRKIKELDIGLLCMKTLVQRKWLEGEQRTFPKSWCKPIWDNEELGVCAMKYGFYKGGSTLVPPGNIHHFNFMLKHIDECLDSPLTAGELDYLRAEADKVRDHLIFST